MQGAGAGLAPESPHTFTNVSYKCSDLEHISQYQQHEGSCETHEVILIDLP